MDSQRATISAALICLICFFLPWIQVSCGGARDTESGFDLARDGTAGLWLIPILMVTVLFVGLRLWKERRELAAIVSLVSGFVSAYLMNRERLKFEDSAGLISVTGWFWLSFGSSVALLILGAARMLTGRKDGKVIDDA